MIALRVGLGLTQKQLAERTGMTQPEIARLESGEHAPKWDTLTRVFAATLATVEVSAEGPEGKPVKITFSPESWTAAANTRRNGKRFRKLN